ncbi:MAG: prepilin-type N-terminal cleavage/methylation domain-containing protein, partial [bacterium]
IRTNGFTLIEMAMVLMIVGLLLGGMLVPLSAQMDQRNSTDTQKQLAEIKEALIGYALANGQLPCPANPTDVTGVTATAGIARTPPCTGASSTGVLPWATLGVNETDAWGNRFTYRVTSDFADAIGNSTYGGCTPSPIPTQASFGLCSTGNLNVLSAASGGTNIASNVPAVIISHGKNAAGAYTPQGTQIAVGSNADELENSNGNTTFISHSPSPTFDDLVVWISPNILFNRMVSAGKLP